MTDFREIDSIRDEVDRITREVKDRAVAFCYVIIAIVLCFGAALSLMIAVLAEH